MWQGPTALGDRRLSCPISRASLEIFQSGLVACTFGCWFGRLGCLSMQRWMRKIRIDHERFMKWSSFRRDTPAQRPPAPQLAEKKMWLPGDGASNFQLLFLLRKIL